MYKDYIPPERLVSDHQQKSCLMVARLSPYSAFADYAKALLVTLSCNMPGAYAAKRVLCGLPAGGQLAGAAVHLVRNWLHLCLMLCAPGM